MTNPQNVLLERIRHEGPVLPLGGGAIGIFDPALTISVDNSNTAGLILRPAPWDRIRGRDVRPLYWTDVRKLLLEQSSRMSRSDRLAALHGEMRRHVLAQAGARVDLARLAARSAVHPLIGLIIAGLDRRAFDRLAATQDARLERQVQAGVRPESAKARLGYRLLEIRAGRLIAGALRRRRKQAASGQDDFAGALLGIGDRLGMTRVNYLVQSLLIAASTAPGALAACLVHALATRPRWRLAIRGELRQLPPGALYDDSRGRLPLTAAFIKEALRLWTFPLIAGRMATRRHEVAGHTIEKGAPYALSSYAMHRCPRHWADPEAFDPERWAQPQPAPERGSYVPFGFGSRTCVAASLGEAQMFLLCALFADEFEIECDEGAEAPIEIGALAFPRNFIGTVRPRAG